MTENNGGLFLIFIGACVVAILIAIGITKYLSNYFSAVEYIKGEMARSFSDR